MSTRIVRYRNVSGEIDMDLHDQTLEICGPSLQLVTRKWNPETYLLSVQDAKFLVAQPEDEDRFWQALEHLDTVIAQMIESGELLDHPRYLAHLRATGVQFEGHE